jgi:hypothetical protein
VKNCRMPAKFCVTLTIRPIELQNADIGMARHRYTLQPGSDQVITFDFLLISIPGRFVFGKDVPP